MTTLITGATSGIGESLAKLYADNNEHVIACGRNTEKLAKLSQHQNIESCQFDATDLQDIRSSTVAYTHEFDRVILNAGNCEYIDDARNFDSSLFERVDYHQSTQYGLLP